MNASTASIRDILVEDLGGYDTQLHVEWAGTKIQFSIEKEDPDDPVPPVVMTRDEARKLARKLLEMTR